MKINIYVPREYDPSKKYPVLYLLHGYGENQNAWMPIIKTNEKAQKLIDSKKIKPLIIVSPQMDNSFGLNTKVNLNEKNKEKKGRFARGMYEDYFLKEVIPYVDSHYSTIKTREGRYIGGFSMGGCTALYMAFTHTDMFSKVGGHSTSLFLDKSQELYPTEKDHQERDPLYLAKEKDLTSLKVYLDCGKWDFFKFYEGSEQLQKILTSKEVQSEYHLNNGTHLKSYWKANAEKYLMFYAGM